MEYIWDILLHAKEQHIQEQGLFFAQAKDCSPWYEQSFPCLNETEVRVRSVEINALYRFAHIFQELLHEAGDSEFRAFLFDAGIHLLANQDLLSGLSIRDFYVQKLISELESGAYGETTTQTFHTLSPEQQRKVASLTLAQYETGSSLFIFRQAITLFYPNCLLYQLRAEPETLLLYLGLPAEQARQVQMLQELFLPVQYQLRVFWTEHFGVMDVDSTLYMDAIEIY